MDLKMQVVINSADFEEAFESHLFYFMRLIPAQLMPPCLRELRGGEMMKRQRFPHYEKIK